MTSRGNREENRRMGLTASAALQSAPRKERGTVGWRREREEMRETDGSQRSNNVDFGNSDDDGKRLRQDQISTAPQSRHFCRPTEIGSKERALPGIQNYVLCERALYLNRCPNGGTKTNGMHRQA